MEFRALRADEVECRIGQVAKSGKGLSLLLYKTARTDMAVLDEAVGAENWQCRYYECKGTLFCSLGLRIGGEWVWKDNAGSPSNMEAEKGEASDAMKRAGFAWGIGRELYTAPFVWVPSDRCSIQNGKCYDRFDVARLESEGGRITELVVADAKGRPVFSWAASAKQMAPRGHEGPSKATSAKGAGERPEGDHLAPIRALMRPYADARRIPTKEAVAELTDYMGIARMQDLTPEGAEELERVMRQTIDCVGGAS